MKNKGFTLVELLAVLVILAVILTLALPAVTNVINKSKETIHDVQISKILNASYDYSLKNTNILPVYNQTNYIILNELKKKGFIDSDIKDSTTKEEFSNDLVISIKNVGGNYKYNNKNSILEGNYLYTVESDFMKTEEFKNNKPSITIEGYSTSLTTKINVGSSFEIPKCSATDSSGNDITSNISINIIHDSKNVDKVSTDKAAIYYINYCVVDLNGYSACSTLNLILEDNELPELNVPDNITISKSDTEFDLMEDVSCEDNSGKCKISINGSINYGVSGKYVIEYFATDPTGNTSTEKRVITVE